MCIRDRNNTVELNSLDILKTTEDEKINEKIYEFNEIKVSKGDNFAKILKKGGLKGRDVDLVILNGKDYYDFSKLYIGDTVRIFSDYGSEGLKLFNLIYKYSDTKELIISYKDDSFTYEIKEIPLISEKIFVSGENQLSLIHI